MEQNKHAYLYKHIADRNIDGTVVNCHICSEIRSKDIVRYIIRQNNEQQYGVYAVDTLNSKGLVRRYMNYSAVVFSDDVKKVIAGIIHIRPEDFYFVQQYYNISFYKDSIEVLEGFRDYVHDKAPNSFVNAPILKKAVVPGSIYFAQYLLDYYYPPFLEEHWSDR